MEALEVRYTYRDGSNNKRCQSVALSNPDGITSEQLEEAIRVRFRGLQVWPDVLHFQPGVLGWPTAYFPGHDLNGDDLTVHEVDRISRTEAIDDDPAQICCYPGQL